MGKITDALIDKHRYLNVEDSYWYQGIYGDVKQEQAEHGVTVDRCYFSGFYSQGDGACFIGRIMGEDMLKFMEAHGLDTKHPFTAKLAKRKGVGVNINHRDRYYHENSVDFGFYYEQFNYVSDDASDPVMETIYEVWQAEQEKEISDFEDAVKDTLRSAMQDLYRRLEEEHDYQTSDEQVRDALEANEIYAEDEEEDDACYA